MWEDMQYLSVRKIRLLDKTSIWPRMVFIRGQIEVGARSAQVLPESGTEGNCRKPARTMKPSVRIVVYARTMNLSAHKRRS